MTNDPSLGETLQQIGKGLTQLNLRVSRLVEAAPATNKASGGEELLEPLFDLIEAVDRAVHEGREKPRIWRSKRNEALWRGLAMARAAAVERLRALGIEGVPEEGPFDSRVHRVIEIVPCSAPQRAGTLANTNRRGWMKSGVPTRVLRTALVSVYEGGEQAH